MVPLSVLFSRQNELLPDIFSENLKILEIFVIGPHAFLQCIGPFPPNRNLEWTALRVDPFPDPVGHFGAPWWPFWIFEVLIEGMVE